LGALPGVVLPVAYCSTRGLLSLEWGRPSSSSIEL
jgi:hypothetical protein